MATETKFMTRRLVRRIKSPNSTDKSALTLQEQVAQLTQLLDAERTKCTEESAKAARLSEELEETKSQLEKQKRLKEMFLNTGRATRAELARLQVQADEATAALSNTAICSKVHHEIRNRRRKTLQRNYEGLKGPHAAAAAAAAGKSSAELKLEKEKTKGLQEQLEKAKVLYQELSANYETDVQAMKQRAEALQRELDAQKKAHAAKAEEDQQLISKLKSAAKAIQRELDKEVKAHSQTATSEQQLRESLKAEQEAAHRFVAQEVATLRQAGIEKEAAFQAQLEELRSQLKEQVTLNKRPSAAAENSKDKDFGSPRRKHARRQEGATVQKEPDSSGLTADQFIEEFQDSEETLPSPSDPFQDYSMASSASESSMATPDSDFDYHADRYSPGFSTPSQVSEDEDSQDCSEPTSLWTKTCHLLGLTKSDKPKKTKDYSSEVY